MEYMLLIYIIFSAYVLNVVIAFKIFLNIIGDRHYKNQVIKLDYKQENKIKNIFLFWCIIPIVNIFIMLALKTIVKNKQLADTFKNI